MNLTLLKRMITKDWLAKLISVIVAVLLWVYVNHEELPIKNTPKIVNTNIKIGTNFKTSLIKDIRVGVKNLSQELRVINTNDLYADVSVYGPAEKLEKLAATNEFLFIDLNGINQPRQQKFLIQSKIFSNYKVLDIEPKEVMVNMRRK